MTVENLISKIRIMLGAQTQEVTKIQTAFADLQLVDGTKVMVEGELAVGNILLVESAEGGEPTPAPTAVHETTDGLLITVGEGGVIEAIEELAPAADVVTEEVAMEEVEVSTEVAPEAAVATEELLTGIAELIAPFTQEIESLKQELSKLTERFNVIADEPARKPITRTFAEEAKAASTIAEARLAKLAQLRKNK